MKNRIIALILTLTTLFSVFAVTANAAREETFISEVSLVYEDSVEDAREAIKGTDWNLLEYNLNSKADYIFDDGVYLIYKTSNNVEDAITNLRVMDMYGGYSTANYENQLKATRDAYAKIISYLRTAMAEFKTLYNAGDDMAKLAYRQMNYYKDMGETDLLMGDFFLGDPTDDEIITVMMEGNTLVVTSLIALFAVSLSGGESLATKISAKYEIKDTLTDDDYYDDTKKLISAFNDLSARVKRYNALSEKYDITDEKMSEEEFEFLNNYASVALLLDEIPYGEESLKEFLCGTWETKDLYPIVAALSEGQMALAEMGVFTIVLQYSAPSKSIEELYKLVEETEKTITDENGNLKIYNVYAGVDRSIFEGNFAFTNAAERQQALTGYEWNASDYLENKANDEIPYTAVYALLGSGVALTVSPFVLTLWLKLIAKIALAFSAKELVMPGLAIWGALSRFLMGKVTDGVASFAGVKILIAAGVGLMLASVGVIGVSIWYGYYNPDYTPIPDNIVDVRETDIGDKYIKYTAAKVYNDEEGRNADFNAYEGKEWIALYYTKDVNAGYALTNNFSFSETNNTAARRYQAVAMFGEDKAYDLNSHVFDDDAKSAYLTVRYSTTKKAAADVPAVVGSMFAEGALYTLTALGGAGLGVGGTVLVQNLKKKKKQDEADIPTEKA